MCIKVLIVDDHAIVRSGITLLLQMQPDMQVVGEAHNGAQAYELTIANKPDVVLMDISMKGENGLSATLRLKQALPGIEILILTMFEDKDLMYNALQAGASGYILKSAKETEMMDAIRSVYRKEVYLYSSAATELLLDYISKVETGDLSFDFSSLSAREQEIVSLAARGYTNKNISEQLFMSVKTVETHKSKIMEKLQIKTRQELVSYAYKHGLLHFE